MTIDKINLIGQEGYTCSCTFFAKLKIKLYHNMTSDNIIIAVKKQYVFDSSPVPFALGE